MFDKVVLILRLSDLQQNVRSSLFDRISMATTPGELRLNIDFLNKVKGLYKTAQSFCYMLSPNDLSVTILHAALKKTYGIADMPVRQAIVGSLTPLVSAFRALSGQRDSFAFYSAAAIFESHKKILRQKIKVALDRKSADLASSLIVLYKHKLLQYHRKDIDSIRRLNQGRLMALKKHDAFLKYHIYGLSVGELVSQLSFSFLVEFYRALQLTTLREELVNAKRKQYENNRFWEVGLTSCLAKQQSGLSFAYGQCVYWLDRLYAGSLGALGLALFEKVSVPNALEYQFNHGVREPLLGCIHTVLEKASLYCPGFSHKLNVYIDALFDQASITTLLGLFGQGLGVLFTLFLGGYSLLRTQAIQTLLYRFSQQVVNDELAIIGGAAKSINQAYFMMSLLLACLEMLWFGDEIYLISVLAGSFAGSLVGKATQNLELDPDAKLYTDFIFDMLIRYGVCQAYKEGRLVYNNFQEKLAARSALLNELPSSVGVKFPDVIRSPSFLFGKKNPVSFFWQDEGVEYSADCEIMTTNAEGSVEGFVACPDVQAASSSQSVPMLK